MVYDRAELVERLIALLRPGDRIVWGQGAAEPTPVLKAVLEAADRHGAELLVTLAFSDTVDAAVERRFTVQRTGGMGTARRLSGARVLPVHLSALPGLMRSREVRVDVAVVQVSPADLHGRHSLGIDATYSAAALGAARVRIAEVNARMPWLDGHDPVDSATFDLLVHTDRPLLEVPAEELSSVDRAIGRHAAEFIDDRAVLQAGVGRVPGAVLELLSDRRDLGVHTGLLGESIWRLICCGAVTNAHKEIDVGATVAGTLAGSAQMYAMARAANVLVKEAMSTHGLPALAALSRFTAVNSAVEVDLTGQVNAEWTGARFVGAVGGLGDFARAAQLSAEGRSIIALPSTTSDGRSRIVASLHSGTVTVPRSDADVIVTEWGAAQLRGCDVPERVRRLVAVAAPQFRTELSRAAG